MRLNLGYFLKASEQVLEDSIVTAKIIPEDDIDACYGDQMLGVFMHKLFAWAENTEAILTKIKGASWIGCSTNRWITERKPWGKKVKVSRHQLERMLARGRKMGVLETCQWPSRFEMWKTVLHVRPTDGYSERRTSAAQRRSDAGPIQGFYRTDAGPVQNPDQDHETTSGTESVIGVPAGAGHAITPPACAPGEEHEVVAFSGGPPPLPVRSANAPSREAVTPKPLWKVWADACFEHHDMKLERPTEKQKGQLRTLTTVVLGRGSDPVTFVNTVIASWTHLTRQVRAKTDDVQYIPDRPCLGFTTYFLAHLISVVQDEVVRAVKEARNDAERKAQREKDKSEREAAQLAYQRAHQAEQDALAMQGAAFATKEAAVVAMYRSIGRDDAPQSVRGESIRAFLSSWGGDDQLNDTAILAKYRHDLVNGFCDCCATETAEDEEQFITSGVVPFPKAA